MTSPKPIGENTLSCGDDLPILRGHIADESIDLVYLDPPFNSNRSHNVLFQDESGKDSESEIEVFTDTWHWARLGKEGLLEGRVNLEPIHSSKATRQPGKRGNAQGIDTQLCLDRGLELTRGQD